MSTSATTATPTTRKRYAVDTAEVERAIRLLIPAGQVVEVRSPKAISAQDRRPHVIDGFFDSAETLARGLAYITEAEGIYFTLNEFDPAHLALAHNRLIDRPASTIADAHITRRRWLPIDLDPERPVKNVSATDVEHTLALDRARRIAEALQAEGWPAPIQIDSGNGAWLLWAIDLPADDGGLVQQCLQALAARFDDALVKVDLTVYNPARIGKIPGTWARKGDDTPERPHRRARLLVVPDQVQTVSRTQLEALAAARPQEPARPQRPQPASGDFDLEKWIGEHLSGAKGPRDWTTQAGKGRKWVLDCPWNSDHANSAWVGELGNGAITAGCQHQSCTWTWEDLRAKFEPGHRERVADRRNGGSDHQPATTSQPATKRKTPTPSQPAEPVPVPSADFTGPAIWRNRDHDAPVEIAGQAGPGPDGRMYMRLVDSPTAIPLDELYLPPAVTATTDNTEPPDWPPASDLLTEPPTPSTRPAGRPVAEIIAEMEALRPEGGEKPDRTLVEAKALDLVADCAGLNRTDLQRIEVTLRTLGLPQEFARNWRAAVREAMRTANFTAGSAIMLDGRPASWPYTVDERRTWLLREASLPDGSTRIERTLVADFSGLITEEAISEDGAKHWTIEGETSTGLPFSIEIPALEFADSRLLSAKLTQAAGPQAPVRAKMAVHLPPAIQLCSRETPRQLRRFERTGWDDAGRFLIPGREPAGVRLVLQPTLPYRLTADADLTQGLAALTDLIEAMGPERGMIILGAMVIGPIARLAGWENERSALFCAGRTGTLKTSTLQTAMSIWGPEFTRDDRLIRWGEGATGNAIMSVATYASDLPLLIDNYKPGVAGGAKTFRALIHAIVEGSEKLRLKSSSDLRDQKLIACWPIFTGEDTPNDDAASLARVLVLHFDWPRGEANERLAQAQRQAQHLNAVGRSLLDWLETDASRPVIASAAQQFPSLRSTWARRIIEADLNATNPLRVASNITTNQLAIWILRHHPDIGPVIAPYADQHSAGLLDLAIGMAQRTAESLEASRFLNTLQELLATGELDLIPESGKDAAGNDYPRPLPERRLGWKAADGTTYLLGQKALSDVLKKLGSEALGGISLPTLYDQLAALGLIASYGRTGDHHTKLVRIAAEGGRPIRVLHLKAAALEFSDEQADE